MFPQEVTTSKHRLYQSSKHIVSALPATKKTCCSTLLLLLLPIIYAISCTTTANASSGCSSVVAPCRLGRHAAARSHIQPQPTGDHNAGDFTPLGLRRQTRAHGAVILLLTAAKTLAASKRLGSGWVICKAVF